MYYRLIYVSSSVGMPSQDDLDDILLSARRNNTADGISGMLLFHEGNFVQVLEGRKEAVLDCLARIEEDRRHRGCMILHAEDCKSLVFGDWAMGYVPRSRFSHTQQNAVIDLRNLGRTKPGQDLTRDETATSIVNSFLSSFRELERV